jgi:hypothetical protein
MNAQPSPRGSQNPDAQTSESGPRPESRRGDGARAKLTIAPDVARRRLKARLLVWGVALVTVASMFMLVSFHVFAAQSAFTLERLSKERTNEQLRYQRLRNMVADRSSAPTVIKAAKAMGMVNGPTPIPLAVRSAGTPAVSAATVGAETPDNSYEKAKHALGPTP